MSQQVDVLRSRRFWPMFGTQLTSAFSDNLFKSAFLLLVTYGQADRGGMQLGVLAVVGGSALIGPFFLFSATAGAMADRFERGDLLRWLKLAELLLAAMAAASLLTGNLALSLLTMLLLGTQSTFTSPVKYALLPQQLREDELIAGNAVMEAGTFLSILAGTIAGSLAVLGAWGVPVLAGLLPVMGLLGVMSSRYILPAPAPAPDLKIGWNIFAETWTIMRQAARQKAAYRAITGTSWFWVVGATILAQIPAWSKDGLGVDSGVVTLFLAAFSIGIGIGATLCGRLMRGEVSARLVPWAALGMAFGSGLMWLWGGPMQGQDLPLIGVDAFLTSAAGWRLLGALLGVAIAGGIYIVPLSAIIQDKSDPDQRARVIAAMNVMNALYMVLGSVVAAILLSLGQTIPLLFLLMGLGSVAAAVYVWRGLRG